MALLQERIPSPVLQHWGSEVIMETQRQGLSRRSRLLTLTYYDVQRLVLPPQVKMDLLVHWGVARQRKWLCPGFA